MLDPRIKALFKEIENLKKAILVLASNFGGVDWRVPTEEERTASDGTEVYNKTKEIIDPEKGEG